VAQTAGTVVRVEGLADLRKGLRKFAPDVNKQLRRDMKAVAGIVAASARSQMPTRTGTARKSVKASTSGNYAQVRAGGVRAPYYGWLDFGGTLGPAGGRRNTQHRPKFKEGRYIYPAIARNRPRIIAASKHAIGKAITEAGMHRG